MRGYIVFQPDTVEAQRLIETWRNEDRPQRYFVPFSWINTCREKRQFLHQVFVENGLPVKIHIHRSIANLNSRGDFTETIMVSSPSIMTASKITQICALVAWR